CRVAFSRRLLGHREAKDQAMIILQDNHRPTPPTSPGIALQPPTLQALAILLLSPVIVAVSAAIMLGLLGIFVAWLVVVSALVTTIVASDLARRSVRFFTGMPGKILQHRVAGFP